MPQLNFAIAHTLGENDALRRIRGLLETLKNEHSGKIEKLCEQWNGNVDTFSFAVKGMEIRGTLAVTDTAIAINAEIPFMAALFKDAIEAKIRSEAATLLAATPQPAAPAPMPILAPAQPPKLRITIPSAGPKLVTPVPAVPQPSPAPAPTAQVPTDPLPPTPTTVPSAQSDQTPPENPPVTAATPIPAPEPPEPVPPTVVPIVNARPRRNFSPIAVAVILIAFNFYIGTNLLSRTKKANMPSPVAAVKTPGVPDTAFEKLPQNAKPSAAKEAKGGEASASGGMENKDAGAKASDESYISATLSHNYRVLHAFVNRVVYITRGTSATTDDTGAPALPPQLVKICTAESGFRQFNPDGTVVRGIANPHDIGLCQINLDHWGSRAQGLGYDIFQETGNRSMAIWLYEHYGTEPWYLSRPLWDK